MANLRHIEKIQNEVVKEIKKGLKGTGYRLLKISIMIEEKETDVDKQKESKRMVQ